MAKGSPTMKVVNACGLFQPFAGAKRYTVLDPGCREEPRFPEPAETQRRHSGWWKEHDL
jgi:hypothetical protein